ncbi:MULTISPECIES: class I SAM-dependent methyltransferase [unclassified Streptomyces]|uniref:class I SAM-dependent methyltransferase n=1 Tax=unclassified Streptomyces TaxID=2593676 RepID=UPI00224EA0C7|nr:MULTISPECIES: class I SAM-dependent methyltransferase [unclassified Streptomyces]MCX4648860.1 class I SAM-dependent methyltransferase [Streptomyces sp. NBC_01446]MCX5323020.1 class I SAM-dependent methyltransferase [Streptomyces sp. NBC_00120]
MGPSWEWDDSLFAGTARYYRRGRLPYAPGLAGTLAELLKPDGRGRLIDVGCGPGVIALSLAHLFSEIVGVDPDRGMVAEATREAAERGVAGKARWVQARAEDLPAGLGTFDVATFAQSFHWMDRDLVAVTIKGMLKTGGVLAHISDLKTETETGAGKGAGTGTGTGTATGAGTGAETRIVGGLPHPVAPRSAIDGLVKEYLGPVRRAGRGVLPHGTPGGEAAVFTRAGFSGPQRYVVPGGQPLERTADDLVAGVFSMSFSAPHLFGTRRDAFETDLRQLLREASPSGLFSERQPSAEIFIWRNDPC